jgi:predicted ATPase
MDPQALQASLDRLADTDLLFVEGAPPEANYRFKHTLIQDAAYDSLLKSRRQALHRRAAELLRADPERAVAEPEAIAHHFTEAGLDDLAIEWWGKAGDQALRRSAFQEAIAHLGKAIAMADKADATRSTSDRLKLQTSYEQAMAWSQGLAAEETMAATARATQLAAVVNDPAARLTVYYGQWFANLVAGQIGPARTIAETYLGEARNAGVLYDVALASRLVGQMSLYQGAFADARVRLETALASYDPSCDTQVRLGQAADIETAGTVNLAIVFWQLGEVERARELTELAKTHAVESERPLTLAYTHWFTALFEAFRGDADATLRDAKTFAQAAGTEAPAWPIHAKIFQGWARAQLHDRESGLEELRQDLTVLEKKVLFMLPAVQGLLSELEVEGSSADGALARVDEALRLATQTGERWTDAFLHRIRGDILLKADSEHPARAEEAYLAAITIAREQGARSFGLQAALKLAKLYQSTARPADAHAILAPALEGFAPTPEMPEIGEAQALLEALAATGAVKVDAARRERRVKLQTAYGQALMWSKGQAAEETRAAFERAGELAARSENRAERYAVYYAQWVRSLVRGDLTSARDTAELFLREADAEGRGVEAVRARASLGTTCQLQGQLALARSCLQRALADNAPEWDMDARRVFGSDNRIVATDYLAWTTWLLGDLECARSLIEQAVREAQQSGHVTTISHAYYYKAALEVYRDDAAATLRVAGALVEIAQERNVAFFEAIGRIIFSWARGRLLDPVAGAAELRQALAGYFDQGNGLGAPWFNGLLAELEAIAGSVENALASVDAGLALAEEKGERWTDPLLFRRKGEILLRLDPVNLALAEEAFRTAIAIAQQQGSRSFGLRAALSLAKLYQSTGRPVEAHAVIAPALEGFSPTPEMPEIPEAQALLVAIEVGAHVRRE